ncbi:MAG TPA: hypothetical protein VLI04_06480 [Nocardioidaceae bacterium]|nr:hypothetical protein [Nocardioidaceae bacterium]
MSEDFTTMVATLRAALESPSDAGRPGQLRLRMEAALGAEEAQRLRRLVHQVVGAAEENLPANLRRIAPLTSESLQRLSGELATSRGWSQEAAQRATQIWAAAMGFEELAASSWPREPVPERPAPAEPVTPVLVEETTPPVPARPEPARPEPAKPVPAAKSPATPAAPTAWPKPHKQLARHTQAKTGEPALTVILAYSGMNLMLVFGLMIALTVVLCLPILFLGSSGILFPIAGALLASLLVRRLGKGGLVATEAGLEFTPYDLNLKKPDLDNVFRASWAEVTVEPGYVTTYRFAGRAVQVGPRNKAFVAAAQPYVGGGAG